MPRVRRPVEEEETQEVSIADLLQEKKRENLADVNLRDLVDKEFKILDISWVQTGYGLVPKLLIEVDGEQMTAITFSEVLTKQIQEIEDKLLDLIHRGVPVKAKVCKRKRYLTFC